MLHGRRICSCRVSCQSILYCDMLTCASEMPVDSLKPLVKALLDQLPDDPSSIVISVKSETEPPLSPDPRKGTPTGPAYDPSHVYLLEFCTVLAIRDSETIAALGADVAEALMNVMRNAPSFHSIMISRTIFYLLHLLHASFVSHIKLCFIYLLTILGTLLPPRTNRIALNIKFQKGLAGEGCATCSSRTHAVYQGARPSQKRDHDLARFLGHSPQLSWECTVCSNCLRDSRGCCYWVTTYCDGR